MNILLTGAGGLLGSAIVEAVEGRAHSVAGLTRSELDVTKLEDVLDAVRSARPDAVIHCAAYTAVDRAEAEPDLARRVNRDGTRNMAAAAAEVGAVLVYVSTDYVFDGTKGSAYLPSDATRPLSVYGRTKLEGERQAAEVAPEHLIIRTSWLYGGDRGFVPAILRRATDGVRLRVVDDQEGRPTWAPDAARTVLDLLQGGARGVWHVAGGGACTWLELAKEAIGQAGLDVPIEAVSTSDFGAAAPRPAYSVLDLGATEEFLGREMRDWRAALACFMKQTALKASESPRG